MTEIKKIQEETINRTFREMDEIIENNYKSIKLWKMFEPDEITEMNDCSLQMLIATFFYNQPSGYLELFISKVIRITNELKKDEKND